MQFEGLDIRFRSGPFYIGLKQITEFAVYFSLFYIDIKPTEVNVITAKGFRSKWFYISLKLIFECRYRATCFESISFYIGLKRIDKL